MNSSRLFPSIQLFSTPQVRWSEPELSIDSYRGMKQGRLHCWDATGPARDSFEQVRQQIIDCLNGAQIQVPSSSMIMVDIFMIGKDQARAKPYIMFSCRHRESRKAAVAAIKESNILDQCPPGILLGDWDYPPHLINLRQLASSAVKSKNCIVINAVEVDEMVRESFRCRFFPVVDLKSGKTRVLRLATQSQSANYGNPRMASIGSIIKLHGKKYYLAPAHVFNPTAPNMTSEKMNSLSEDSECDIGEFDSDDESLSGAQDEADFMSRHSASAESSDIEEDWDLESSDTMSGGESTQDFDELHELPPSTAMANTKSRPPADDMKLFSVNHRAFSNSKPPRLSSDSLDYCLIEIDNGENVSTDLPVLSKDTIGQLNGSSVNVMAITGSGNVLKGILFGRRSCIRLPNSTDFVEVSSVQFEDSLQPGVCGSIVQDENTGKIYGHLVAGDTGSQFAFIVPAINVLNDAMAKMSEPRTMLAYDFEQTPRPPSFSHELTAEPTTQYDNAYWSSQSPSVFSIEETSFSDTSFDRGSIGDSSSLDISLDGLSLADDDCGSLLGNTSHAPPGHFTGKRPLEQAVTDLVEIDAASTKKRRVHSEEARDKVCVHPENIDGLPQAITGLYLKAQDQEPPSVDLSSDLSFSPNAMADHEYSDAQPFVNILAIHGFGESAFTSWAQPQSPCWPCEIDPMPTYKRILRLKWGMISKIPNASSSTGREYAIQSPMDYPWHSRPIDGRGDYHPLWEELKHISDALDYLHEQPQPTLANLSSIHDLSTQSIGIPPLSPTLTDWVPLTTFGYDDEILVNGGRCKKSRSRVANRGHTTSIDSSYSVISYAWDTTRLSECHFCSQYKTKRDISNYNDLKRHVKDQHIPPSEYMCTTHARRLSEEFTRKLNISELTTEVIPLPSITLIYDIYCKIRLYPNGQPTTSGGILIPASTNESKLTLCTNNDYAQSNYQRRLGSSMKREKGVNLSFTQHQVTPLKLNIKICCKDCARCQHTLGVFLEMKAPKREAEESNPVEIRLWICGSLFPCA